MQKRNDAQGDAPSSTMSSATSACEGTEDRALESALLLLMSRCAGLLEVILDTVGGGGCGVLTVALPGDSV